MAAMNELDQPSVETAEDEAERERRWWEFEVECQTFADAEGWDGVLRAVARAMKEHRP